MDESGEFAAPPYPVAGRVYEAMGAERERHCDACFSHDYPLAGSDEAGGKFSLELPLVRAAPVSAPVLPSERHVAVA